MSCILLISSYAIQLLIWSLNSSIDVPSNCCSRLRVHKHPKFAPLKEETLIRRELWSIGGQVMGVVCPRSSSHEGRSQDTSHHTEDIESETLQRRISELEELVVQLSALVVKNVVEQK